MKKGSIPLFTSHFYHANTYKEAYAGKIFPLPQQSLWDPPPYEVGPPATRRQPGRPKSVRRREADELPRYAKKQRICGRCKLPSDHNARSCQGGPVGGNQKTPRAPRPTRPPKEPKQNVPRVPRKTNTAYKRPKTSRGKKKDASSMGTGPQIPSSPQQQPGPPPPHSSTNSSNLMQPGPLPPHSSTNSSNLVHPRPPPPDSSTIPFKSGSDWIHQNLGVHGRANIAAILPPRRPINSVFRPPWNNSVRLNMGTSSSNSNNPSILQQQQKQ